MRSPRSIRVRSVCSTSATSRGRCRIRRSPPAGVACDAMTPLGERNIPIFWWGIASAIALAMGAVGPWASVLSVSINGTDFANGGKIVLGLALVVLLCVLGQRQSPALIAFSFFAGVAALLVTIHDRHRITSVIHLAGPFGSLAKVGWGLNLALAAAVSV